MATNRNKWVAQILVILLLLSLTLSACGGGGGEVAIDATTTTAGDAQTGETATAPAGEAGAGTQATEPAAESEGEAAPGVTGTADLATGSGKAGTVTFWTWNTGGPEEAMAAAFTKAHPDVKLVIKSPEYTDYLNQLKLAMGSGRGPDVIGLQAGGMVKEYDEFLEDLAPYAAKEWGNDWKGKFYSVGIDQLLDGDRAAALPWFNSAAGYVWYNKNIFDQHGLKPPKTFEDLFTVSKQLKAKGVTPFVHGAKDAWVNLDMYINLANEIAPGKIYQAEAGKIPWTDPDLVKAMAQWKRLFDEGVIGKGALATAQYPDAQDKFFSGKAGMILMGMWHDRDMTKAGLADRKKQYKLKEDIIWMPVPFPDVNGDGKPGRLFGGPDVALGMNAESENKDAAWTFISWALSDEGQKFEGSVLNFPALKGYGLDTSDAITPEQKINLQNQVKDLENAVGKRELLYPELDTALGDALQNVATGEQTPQQAMEAVQSESENIDRED